MDARNDMAAPAADRALVFTRLLDAPRERVFELWTDPRHVAQWWGPGGFSTTTHSAEVRAGGTWRFTMHGPDGRDYENRITYLEIDTPQRLVYRHDGNDNDGGDAAPVKFQVTVTFAEEGDKTRLTMRMAFDSADELRRVAEKYSAVEGAHQTLDRLARHATIILPDGPVERQLVITRLLDAPRALVFKVWTEREHLIHWSAPRGFVITHCEGDVRPGGAWRACMRAPDGVDHWLGGTYRDIVAPQRLVFTHRWDNDPDHETLVTVLLSERNGKTELTFHQALFESAAMRDAHFGGWSECFDRLAEHLQAG